jgi:hypothetical protein
MIEILTNIQQSLIHRVSSMASRSQCQIASGGTEENFHFDDHTPPGRETIVVIQPRVRAQGKLARSFLEGSERPPAPIRQQAQARIAAEGSLMAEFAQKIAHTRIVFEIPWGLVRGELVDL